MTDQSQHTASPDAPVKKKRSAWKLGCGIGCGGFILIVIILAGIGYMMIRDSITAFQEIEATTKLMTERYGPVRDFCPAPDGVISSERLKTFLEVRDFLVPLQDEMKQYLTDLLEEIRRLEEQERKGQDADVGVLDIFKGVTKILPKVARYFSSRNTKLMDVEMGLGEYYYIYVLAYYSHLGMTPAHGPDFSFLDDQESDGFSFNIKTIFSDDKPSGQKKKLNRKSGFGSIVPVRQFMIPMMRCQLKKLKAASTAESSVAWLQALEAELQLLDRDERRLPWQDGLPTVLQESIEPFGSQLKETFRPLLNPLEFGPRHGGHTVIE